MFSHVGVKTNFLELKCSIIFVFLLKTLDGPFIGKSCLNMPPQVVEAILLIVTQFLSGSETVNIKMDAINYGILKLLTKRDLERLK